MRITNLIGPGPSQIPTDDGGQHLTLTRHAPGVTVEKNSVAFDVQLENEGAAA
jgi:hypothetical protein